jgi:ElaB/YqjD/DUF883 family membrane-anchored ribosome-binding protein
MATKANVDDNEMLSDLHAALEETESALKDLADEGSAVSQSVRDRISANLKGVKAKLQETEALVSDKAKQAAKATDEYVRENPWQSIGVAAGVGFLVGLLVARRD